MSTTTNIAHQPHVIVFLDNGKTRTCAAPLPSETPDCLSPHHAIFADKATADSNLELWGNRYSGAYFTVPAEMLFEITSEVKTVYTFTKRG